KTGEGDRLFGSVSNANLADALEKEGITMEKKFITIAGGIIKRTGKYDAKIRFHREVVSDLSFDVVAEAK
ncbi:MAG: 50S ribosomal protein L9, partial [Bacteroidetes bacterium]|nr:50S ribosomal protein L9 [Bacteroidota bacterium]